MGDSVSITDYILDKKKWRLTYIRIIGILMSVVGIIGSLFPEWLSPITGASEPIDDIHETIERRVRAGMLLGFGLGFALIPSLKPWNRSIPLVIFYFMTGALIARLIGIGIDGSVDRQWVLVGVEIIFMILAAFWLYKKR